MFTLDLFFIRIEFLLSESGSDLFCDKTTNSSRCETFEYFKYLYVGSLKFILCSVDSFVVSLFQSSAGHCTISMFWLLNSVRWSFEKF